MGGGDYGADRGGAPRLAAISTSLLSAVSVAALLSAGPSLGQETTSEIALPSIQVIAPGPLPATSRRPAAPNRAPSPAARPAARPPPAPADPTVIDRDKVPSTTQVLTADDVVRTNSPNITDTLTQRVPGMSLSDPNGNGVQQEVRYRGFAASPLQGAPQGVAVYMGGVRVNEAFGDTVNWDLIPTNAIARADVWSSNPVFGLNALGGAVNIGMKNGFTYQGFEGEVQGGSFGRGSGAAQYGVQRDDVALSLAA